MTRSKLLDRPFGNGSAEGGSLLPGFGVSPDRGSGAASPDDPAWQADRDIELQIENLICVMQ